MRGASVWARLLGVEKTLVDGVEFDGDLGVLVAYVRPRVGERGRCGVCRRRCPRYDAGEGPRRWRALDLGTVKAYVQAEAPRVRCGEHGVVVAAVPWARHRAGHTRVFDDTVAWLATACSRTAVTQLTRIAWRTVGAIVKRVCAGVDQVVDRLAGLRRIGIDEVSYKKGHKYLTVVVDHDTGRLVWAAPGRDKVTMGRFFRALGEQRCQAITHVSADGAPWIADVVRAWCPQAVLCADPFHVVQWAGEALDEARRAAWNDARRAVGNDRRTTAGGRVINLSRGDAKKLKNARWALRKNPDDLTANQRAKLDWIAASNPRLYRAYLLKEGLRHVFKIKGEDGIQALRHWLSRAQRSRLPGFIELGRKIKRHRATIYAALEEGMSNALIESTNTKIRVITRVAYGFKDPHALIALAML
ncbi:ISL3 family transposase, partial [Phytoactinopolyspora alkaliphila]|nr:ISL3 family transposase [Phytoactinopolyspora alkaliphila]